MSAETNILRKTFPVLFFTLVFMAGLPAALFSQTWYVSTTGSDLNPGTITQPYATIEKAVTSALAGHTIYVRGGTYSLTATILITKSGTESSLISLSAYPGEKPVLDFSGQVFGGSSKGIRLSGSYWHIKGLEISGAGDNGMHIDGGNNNLIENCSFYRNRDSGLQLDNGASGNSIRNCDSYFNADPSDYGDADGFAPKLTVGTGNSFYGCRAWRNCDDGWDGYLRGADDPYTTLENCWAFDNGYLEDGTDPGSQANGNGFKMGGSDDKTLRHNFTLKNCLAFKNKAKGFDQNSNKGSMTLYNCSGHANLVADYRITTTLATGKTLIIKNCVALGAAEIGTFAVQEKNSWLSPFVVTSDDFLSTDPSPAYGPRKSDGSLPDIVYLHPASGSDLIDAGVNVGLPYAGSAPDLGYFETGLTSVQTPLVSGSVTCYPNPVHDRGWIKFTASRSGRLRISLYDVTGRNVISLADQPVEPGEQLIDIDLSGLPGGIYIYRIFINDNPVYVGRLAKTKGNR